MQLRWLKGEFSICQVPDFSHVDMEQAMWFAARRHDERSLLCEREHVPCNALQCEHGYCGFEVVGQLDFSLIGILAGISTALAQARVSILAQSTFDTDCVFLKAAQRRTAVQALQRAGYTFAQEMDDGAL